MRFLTPTERGYLTDDPEGFWTFAYLEVTNFDGTWVNLGNVAVGARNADLLNTISWNDNIDADTLSMTATFLRDVASGVISLSPFRSDSPLNVDDSSAYSPLLDLHRSWRLWGCILPRYTYPSSPSDYREWASGIVDRIDIQGDPATITVQGRGPEADLIDARIAFVDNTADPPAAISQDTPKVYASGTLDTVLQAILDEEMGGGAVPLTVDGSAPSDFVNGWSQQSDVGLMALLTQTAGLFGGLLRYKYDSSDVLSFTLFSPNRNPTSPDWSTDAGEYEKLDAGIGLAQVCNYIYVRYFDDTFGQPLVVTSPNASPAAATSASIARYKLRTMSIDLAASTQVNDQTRAGNLADAARSDLEFPIIEHTLTGRGLWFAELGDYVQLLANGVHYNEDQYGGITSISHTFANGELTSVLGMRAKPAGRYRGWLDFGPGAPRTPFTPAVTSLNAWFYEVTFIFRDAFVGWVANVNQYTRSAKAELSTTDDFAVVLDTKYSDVLNGVAAGDFAGVTRDQVYYVRVTPYSGPLDTGLPTGVAGLPVIDSTFVQYEVPDKPTFDALQSDVTTLTSDLATETADRIAGDAATLASAEAYTDAKVAGLSWKQQVRVATTAAGTLASSFENGDTVDGVTLATGDRILIKDQAAPAENGIYVVNASGAPTRATDADAGAELVNATCYVSEGTTNADTQWTCSTNAPITLGSTSLAFAQLSSGAGVTDGDKGDIVVSGGGTSWVFDSSVVTSAAKTLLDDTTTSAMRTTLGLGTVATLDSDTDGTLAANSDSKVATQKATKTYVDAAIAAAANGITANTQTASYTLVLTDAGKVIEMNVGSANTLTVPPNSSVAFPVGTVIEVYQMGAGQVTLTPGAGVTFRNPAGATLRAQYSTASLRKRATDEWVVSGDVT